MFYDRINSSLTPSCRNWRVVVADRESILRAEDERTRGLLRRQLSPLVAEAVLSEDNPIQGPAQLCDATILFADLRGFTRFAERTPPLEFARFLNEFFGQMTEVVFKYDGVLDKYIGDEVMAVFGVPVAQPDHVERALQAALEMQARHTGLVDSWSNTRSWTPAMGVGIQSGEVLAGTFGSPMRADYTVFGHAVNLAARLTAIAPEQQIVLGDETNRRAAGYAQTEPLGDATLKNVSSRVAAYRLLGVHLNGAAFCVYCGARQAGVAACAACGTPRMTGSGMLTIASVRSTLTGSPPSLGPHLIGVAGPYQGSDFLIDLPCSLGRDALTNQVVLSLDAAVSRRHAVLRDEGFEVVLADLASQNGTLLNDQLVGVAPVHNGDVLTIGRSRLVMSGLRSQTGVSCSR
jgi:class 3 adenylate cyclase